MKNEPGLIEECLESTSVYSGTLLKVYNDTVSLPDKSVTTREWIDHPGASAVIPVFEDGTTLLVEQYRYPVRQIMLEIPAGKRDGDEPFLETARRELDEETGWQADQIEHLGKSYPVLGYSNEIIHFYLATQLRPGVAQKEEDEFLNIHRIPLVEARNMVVSGEIIDMKSIVGIMRAFDRLEIND